MPFALLAAALASLGIHAAALFLTDVDLSLAHDPLPITAEIVLKPRTLETRPVPSAQDKPAVPAKQRLSSRRPANPVPAAALPTESPVAQASAGDAPVESTVASVAAPELAGEAANEVMAPGLPPAGSIRFLVTMGPTGGPIGRATQTWEMHGGEYRLTSTAETAGLVALFRSVRVETESSGRLTPGGLEPRLFTSRRADREGGDRVEFDREAGRLRYANGDERPLPEGAQDLLSLNYQLGWLAKTGEMPITTGRKLGRYPLELLGEELLETPMGPLRTLHFRAAGETTTEVWLAIEKYLLPVKIRHLDKRGDNFEQVAQEIRIH